MAMTRASRNVGLRTRGDASTGAYTTPSPIEPSSGLPPNTYLPSNMSPYAGLPPAYYPPSKLYPVPVVNTVRPEAPAPAQGFGYGGGSPTAIESNVPPPPAYEPGGGIMPTPLPPSRPSGLGGVLSSAVQPAAASIPRSSDSSRSSSCWPRRSRTPSPPSPRRIRVQTTGSATGGRWGRSISRGSWAGCSAVGALRRQPAPPPPPAAVSGARAGGRVAPDMTGISFDANGNPVSGYELGPGISPQDPTQLAGATGKPGWWKALR